MKLLSLTSLLALGQCGMFDSLEDIVEGTFDDLLGGAARASNSAADLLLSLSSKGESVLGDVPAGAIEAWNAVLEQVPNGAQQLKDDILKEISKRTSPKKSKKGTSTSEFEILVEDPRFPNHKVRATDPSKLGVDDVKQYSGYLDVEDADKHFFFWFFESRNDPKNDPVVLWLNGGPGCSSLTGLFFELGPATIGEDLKPKNNKYSWNSNANVIFLDQPVGVGFSYGDDAVSDTVSAGKDTYAFLELFFKQFPEYAGRDFHIAGESYAGHYIPVFGSEILSHDDKHFNLTSVLIGNGLTDPLRQYDSYEPMACGGGGADPVVDPEGCQNMLDSQDRCNSFISSCYESKSAWTCVPASIYCNNVELRPYQETGRNVYDVREDCEGGGLCYPQLDVIDKYLNQESVKEAVGAAGIETYQGCNMDINTNFLFHGDWMQPYYTAVQDLLVKDVPVLIYAGDKDFICNWLGNEVWSRELEWAGHKQFAAKKLSPWTLKKSGKEVGQVRNHKHFTFLRVYEAGHMVPYNQPEASLEMLNRWIKGDFTYA